MLTTSVTVMGESFSEMGQFMTASGNIVNLMVMEYTLIRAPVRIILKAIWNIMGSIRRGL